MKVLIFTEGTILMHLLGKDVNRQERVYQSQQAGIQGEDRNISYESDSPPPPASKGSVYDFTSYIPIGNASGKIINWHRQGAVINYLTSRRIKSEIVLIQNILKKYNFPSSNIVHYRKQGEDYKDVVARVIPDVLIEDDCESIGGKNEMTYFNMKNELKKKIKSVVVKEFGGIDHIPFSYKLIAGSS